MLRRFFNYIFLATIILFTLGCSSQNDDLKPLRIGMNIWPGYEPFALAKENGFLDDNVKISRILSATDVMKAFKSDIIDVACITLDEALIYQDKNDEKIKIITIMDFSTGGDVLIAKKEIQSLKDLKGRLVGVESTALGLFMLTRILEFTPELSIDDLRIVNLEYGHHENEFLQDNIDAVITFEPVKTRLLQNSNAHVLFDSTKIPGEILDVMVVKEKAIKTKKNAIKSMVDGWYKSVDYISKNKAASISKMAGYENITTDEFKVAYQGIKVLSRDENIDFFESKLHKTIEKVERTLAEKMIIENKNLSKSLYSDLFLHK